MTAGSVGCVVTQQSDFTWHHLNHDPSDHRISNIIPLIQALNTNLYAAQHDRKGLDGSLNYKELKTRAETAFWVDGQVARAYGCARIAYYVSLYSKQPLSFQLDCARQALYYARHKLNYAILQELIVDTVQRPLDKQTAAICPEVIRSLLQELEALLSVGGETAEALRLRMYGQLATPPKDKVTRAGALRRAAHTLGMSRGPNHEVLSLLDESAMIIENENQELSVANTKSDLYLGEDTMQGYRAAMEAVAEPYKRLIVSRVNVYHGRVWPRSKSSDLPTLPIRATPANIADLALMLAVTVAINKPRGWRHLLTDAICISAYYWEVAGARLDAPGRGTWNRVANSLYNLGLQQRELAQLIDSLKVRPMPAGLKRAILRAAETLARRRR